MQKKPMTAARRERAMQKEKKQKTKKTVTFIVLGVLAAALVVGLALWIPSLISDAQHKGLVKLSKVTNTEDDMFMDTSSYIIYIPANPCYEPAFTGKPYAYCPEWNDHVFYTVGDESPEDYLADEFGGTGTTLYVNTEVGLPAFRRFNPTQLSICNDGYERVAEIAHVSDASLVEEIVRLFLDGENIEDVPFDSYEYKLNLKFSTIVWPAVYYNLSYLHCPDQNYIFDRYSKRCVAVGDILAEYIHMD